MKKLGVSCPDVRVIAHYEKEFKFMMHELDKLASRSYDGREAIMRGVKAHLDRPFIML